MLIYLFQTGRQFYRRCKKDNIDAFAAQSAFFIVISIIPFLLIIVSILQYTFVSKDIFLTIISNTMPDYVALFITNIIDDIYDKSVAIVSVTAFLALWSSGKGIQYMTSGLNKINGIIEARNWFLLRSWSVIYTLLFQIAIISMLVLLVFGNKIELYFTQHLPFLGNAIRLFFQLRQVIVLAILVLFFSVLFVVLPDRKLHINKVGFFKQLPGAILCALAWYGFSHALSIYVNYFNGFSMYGNLTTIVLVMLWLYCCMYLFFMCAEFNVVFSETIQAKYLQRKQRKREST